MYFCRKPIHFFFFFFPKEILLFVVTLILVLQGHERNFLTAIPVVVYERGKIKGQLRHETGVAVCSLQTFGYRTFLYYQEKEKHLVYRKLDRGGGGNTVVRR